MNVTQQAIDYINNSVVGNSPSKIISQAQNLPFGIGNFVKGMTGDVNANWENDQTARLGQSIAYSPGDPVGPISHALSSMDMSHLLPLAMLLSKDAPMGEEAINAASKAQGEFGNTVQFGREIGGSGGNHEIMLIDQNGKHIDSRFYNSADQVQNALSRMALPQGWSATPRELTNDPQLLKEYKASLK